MSFRAEREIHLNYTIVVIGFVVVIHSRRKFFEEKLSPRILSPTLSLLVCNHSQIPSAHQVEHNPFVQALILERANTSVRPTGTVFGRGSSACLPLNDIDFGSEWEREKIIYHHNDDDIE